MSSKQVDMMSLSNANFDFQNLSNANANRGIKVGSRNVLHWFSSIK